MTTEGSSRPEPGAEVAPVERTVGSGLTRLVPMTAAFFPQYAEESAAAYAQDNVDAGRTPAQGALERAQAELAALLPQGVNTPDNHLFEIHDGAGNRVGIIWFAATEKHGVRSAYVYDVLVYPKCQRLGHARRAFQAIEPLARAQGLQSIGLHVFGHNPGAQALYAKLGYGVTGLNMLKQL